MDWIGCGLMKAALRKLRETLIRIATIPVDIHTVHSKLRVRNFVTTQILTVPDFLP
jgi:hypothetical protein